MKQITEAALDAAASKADADYQAAREDGVRYLSQCEYVGTELLDTIQAFLAALGGSPYNDEAAVLRSRLIEQRAQDRSWRYRA